MDKKKVYIKGATQISIQQPLSECWISQPMIYDTPYMRSADPSFRDWLNPLESRRMGKILKRALVTAMKVMKDTGIINPDAIITGTGLGCIENTEIFLNELCKEGEEMLKPTCFMQSTHNTISSLIAIYCNCHGYNSTYSHKSISFDSALLDAYTQIRLGDISNALVTGNDEMTPTYFSILQRSGYVGQPGQVTAGEASVAMILSEDGSNALCEIEDINFFYSMDAITPVHAPFDVILMGINGQEDNDCIYRNLQALLPDVPIIKYKHIFGECYSASAIGMYAAAHLLNEDKIPVFMSVAKADKPLEDVKKMLVVNHSDGRCVTLISLRKLQ